MTLISISFLLFVIMSVLCYYITPDKHKWKTLLLFSILYYFILCNKYILYMLCTIVTTYWATRRIESIFDKMHQTIKEHKSIWQKEARISYKKEMEAKAKGIFILTLSLNFGILIVVKYANFITDIFTSICHAFGILIPTVHFQFLLPLGISFYTFQTMGYLIDVYQEKIPAEKNPFKLALFVSFFPQIIQGPIAMYSNLAKQLYEPHHFDYEKTKRAALLILWGLFKKLVIADRAVLLINYVTEDSSSFAGTYLFFTTLVYALQLYADFSGGIDIVRGIGELFGITMEENFRRPYFSKSLTEYWHRWHITLGNWVRTYVFYPLSISKRFIKMGKWMNNHWNRHFAKILPTSFASIITFLIIGLWHGANSKYIAFGLWNGVVIMIIELLQPVTDWIKATLHIKNQSRLYQSICVLWTFILVLIGYYFDIAQNMNDAFFMIYQSVFDFHFSDFTKLDTILSACGLDRLDLLILLLSTILLFVVSLIQEYKQLEIRNWILTRKLTYRWIILYICIFTVLVFGFYGFGIQPADFVYMQF